MFFIIPFPNMSKNEVVSNSLADCKGLVVVIFLAEALKSEGSPTFRLLRLLN